MIRVERLRKSFGSIVAVDGVSFQAEDGQITGILGPNGAGKTTTLRMISTLIRPDSGAAYVDELDAQREPFLALARLGVLPDSRGLYPRLTVREHLMYFGRLQRMPTQQLRARIDELSELLGMDKIIDRRVEGFSQGERTKVAIGRALVHAPDNIILDEATNGLDVMSARAVRDIIRRLTESGKCVLFSSHVMHEVAELCDRIIVFNKGAIAAEGSASSLLAITGESDLESAFVRLVGTTEGLR